MGQLLFIISVTAFFVEVHNILYIYIYIYIYIYVCVCVCTTLCTGPGASSNCRDPTYHGAYPLSESETEAMREAMVATEGLNVYVTLHSYKQQWMLPWWFNSTKPSDYDELVGLSIHTHTHTHTYIYIYIYYYNVTHEVQIILTRLTLRSLLYLYFLYDIWNQLFLNSLFLYSQLPPPPLGLWLTTMSLRQAPAHPEHIACVGRVYGQLRGPCYALFMNINFKQLISL